ncbi:MAG: hypothetical protein DMF80_11245 [Acidobacteria bacterium]|nr:MAG: hypothetical protein DMF80_11245 [Acidobacteriota bacterium]
MRTLRPLRASVVVLSLLLASSPSPAAEKKTAPAVPEPGITAEKLKGLEFRSIGPALMGGRIDDFAVVESHPSTFYVGAASGGLWKTENNGTTFEPVFDEQDSSSIGDVTVAPSDPSIVYVGTGEPNNRQSSSWGQGVYRTSDGGKTWTHLGLADSHHIGRIVVHPANPDVVYVAAVGHLWGPNKERGLYKSSDGGKTWTNTKFVDEDTGFVDVAMDPQSPNILYAASYQRRRTPFGYSGGGPGSALWKTTDGGAAWKKLSGGLPTEGDLGRIGVDVYRRDPRIVYALVEHAKEGGIYRSEDRGETWKKVSDTNPRPSYYSQVHVDPSNDQRVWVLGAAMFYSEDGGKTFRTDLVQKIHGDYHALWIDPANSDHMLAGSDGGIHLSWDRGRSWDYINTVALAQFYEVAYDMRQPYRVCGGLQDNGSWCGPSRTLYSQGIANEDWFRIGGGDGFFAAVDPTDPDVVYTESQDGNVQRMDLKTNERRVIRPDNVDGERYRFNWNSPIFISPHDPKTVFYGGNRLFISHDRGDAWTRTADLTSGASRDKMTIFGKAAKDFLSRNDGVVHFGTITTIAESPLKAGVLWVGTDDGNLQVSRDGGVTWASVASKVPGLPRGTYVSRVEAGHTGEGAAYVAFDGHRADDYGVYVFRTEDYGQTWRSVAGNLPKGWTVHVVREHPRNANLLFAGTENGLWASWDRGGQWVRLKGKMPTVPVFDVQVHARDDDLIVATHGRGIFILDDISTLAGLNAAALSADVRLFDLRPGAEYRVYGHKGNTGHKAFLGPNPAEGAAITYALRSKPADKEEVKIVVKDASGATVRELKGPKEAGINRTSWDLRHEPPVRREPGDAGGEAFFGPPRGPLVPPGTYTVTVSVGPASDSKPVTVQDDPRVRVSEANRRAWYDATRRAAHLWSRADAVNRSAASLKKQLGDLQQSLAKRETTPPETLASAARAAASKADALARRMSRQESLGFAGAPLEDDPDPLLSRARGIYLAIGSTTAAPTPQQQQAMDEVARQLDELSKEANVLIAQDVPALNRLLTDSGLGRIEAGRPVD